jgi:hypothetical protein
MPKTSNTALPRARALGLGLATGLSAGLMLGLGPASHAAIIYSGCAGPASCTLQELFLGGSIRVDSLLFHNLVTASFVTISADNVTVTGTGDGTSAPGLVHAFSVVDDESWELFYTFDLSSVAETTVTGQSISLVSFTAGSAIQSPLGSLDVGFGNSVVTPPAPTASMIFGAPLSGTGLLTSGIVRFEHFDYPGHTLTQASYGFTLGSPTSDIPAPLPLALISIGVAALAGMRLWRKG